ncbi:MAG: hypoxanthine phosphoribosyltransferase [Desulfuromonadales bacterium]|nr:hypoxanthine phosphoribosyltransferase [Desulfuromonadales bacterium]
MHNLSLRPLYSRQEIAAKVEEIAGRIDADYAGKEIVMVAILKGSILFIADLARAVQTPVLLDFMRVASYGAETSSSGEVEIRKDLELDIAGRDVLIVEDIIDSGLTLQTLYRHLLAKQPNSLRICTLIDKKARREARVPVDYVGFSMEDGFIIGYGLDLDERYRDLPDIRLVEMN